MYQPEIGNWTWVELMTRNRSQAEDFYGALLGWQFDYMPEMEYGVAKNAYRMVAGLFDVSKMPEMAGIPANWSPYLEVADVDAAVALGEGNGGTTMRPGWDIEAVGRMAVVGDPDGAVFNLMRGAPEEQAPPPRGETTEVGDWHWWELRTRAREATKSYYGKLANWEFMPGPDASMAYDMGAIGGRPIAGVWDITDLDFMTGVPAHWMGFVAVENIDEAFERAAKAGGKALGPPMEVENVGRFGQIQDHEGATLGLITPASYS